MKAMGWAAFKRLSAEEVRQSECIEVTADGDHVFYAIIGAKGDMKTQIEGRAGLINAARGTGHADSGG